MFFNKESDFRSLFRDLKRIGDRRNSGCIKVYYNYMCEIVFLFVKDS